MTARLLLPLALGLVVLAAVLLRFDMGAVMASLARVGLGGFAVIVAAGLLGEVVLAVGIIPLLPRAHAASARSSPRASCAIPPPTCCP